MFPRSGRVVRETLTQPDRYDCINNHRPRRKGVTVTPDLDHQADGNHEHLVCGHFAGGRSLGNFAPHFRNRDTSDAASGPRRADRNRPNSNPALYRPHKRPPLKPIPSPW